MYGDARPYNYGENYDKIDIPILFFISMQDYLMRADDVIKHYEALKQHHSKLASVKVFDGLGHCDFNYRHHDALAVALQEALWKSIEEDTSNSSSSSGG